MRRSTTAGSRKASRSRRCSRSRRAGGASGRCGSRSSAPARRRPEPVVSEPILRRLGDDEIALVEAAELFNATQFRRTIAGVAKALGEPQASIIPLSGVNAEMVLTFAWDISWYQYRVSPESSQPVRVAERGQDIADLDPSFQHWNATVTEDGRLIPSIERI